MKNPLDLLFGEKKTVGDVEIDPIKGAEARYLYQMMMAQRERENYFSQLGKNRHRKHTRGRMRDESGTLKGRLIELGQINVNGVKYSRINSLYSQLAEMSGFDKFGYLTTDARTKIGKMLGQVANRTLRMEVAKRLGMKEKDIVYAAS